MTPGTLVADRFLIVELAGSGGMGAVYRAHDRVEGGAVALKVMHPREDEENERFLEEARTLAELVHPAIVRYVAHGATPDRRVYLAMEWLEGQDLGRLVERGGLDVPQSIALARRIAAGLEAVHARGIVHRDVKPSNIFLVAGDAAHAKLLDFGVARRGDRARVLTRSGAIMGTVGYMAPEQATGAGDLDARVDVFSLGCLLFECLTGRPAFVGNHLVTVLAKVLCEEAPRLRDLRPELPVALDALVAGMLAKDRTSRFADGGAVRRALEELGDLEGGLPAATSRRPAILTAGERRLVSVMLIEARLTPSQRPEVVHGSDHTLTAEPVSSRFDPLRAILEKFSAVAHPLASGAILATISSQRTGAGELAAQAAACASAVREVEPRARIAIATGRAETLGLSPSGPVIDRAGTLLRRTRGAAIVLDEVTAGLLEARYELEHHGDAIHLGRRRTGIGVMRTLLGKPTPCVGRDKELAILEATLRECVEDGVARAVLVTAPPGTGKSRLAQELCLRVAADGIADIVHARVDSVGAGAALSLARQLVRESTGVRDGDGWERLRDAVAERVSQEPRRVAEMLGELIAVPSTDDPTPQLRAARNDPRILREWMQRSFDEWIGALAAARPLLVVVEDLHWGDLPSVKYLGDALRRHRELPFMVLALARPEVHDAFPELWPFASPTELRLGGLTRKSAERLVRAALGDAIPPSLVTRLIERADGNAFYLEELIRHVSTSDPVAASALPETVLAMVQSRFSSLDPEARRVLRAASIFGETAWQGGIATLLGGARSADLSTWLDGLVAEELFVQSRGSKLAGQREIVFRHSLLREAAYETLTEDDRKLGHGLAAEWLASLAGQGDGGEVDALVVAEHFERGGEAARAVPWLLRAAQAALAGNELDTAYQLAERAVAAGAEGETLGTLHLVQTQAVGWRGDWKGALAHALEVHPRAKEGSPDWFTGLAAIVFAGANLGDPMAIATVVPALLGSTVEPPPTGPFGYAAMLVVIGMSIVGQRPIAAMFMERIARAEASGPADPVFVGWARIARIHTDVQEHEDLSRALADAAESEACFELAGDPVGATTARYFGAFVRFERGEYDLAREGFRRTQMESEGLGIDFVRNWARYWQARISFEHGDFAAALTGVASFFDESDVQFIEHARALRAEVSVELARWEDAEADARSLLDSMHSTVLAIAHVVMARVTLARGDGAAALSHVQEGLALGERAAVHPVERAWLRALLVEALAATGDASASVEALARARARGEEVARAAAADAYLQSRPLRRLHALTA